MKNPRNKGAFAGVFAALLFAAALVGACGVLLESALRAHGPVERFGAAAAVVTGEQSVRVRLKQLGDAPVQQSRPLAEHARVPAAAAERLRAVPGVRDVVADVSFPVLAASGWSAAGHGWASAALRPYALSSGREPRAADEVVLSASAGVEPGGLVRLQVAGEPRPYRVTGLVGAGPEAAFFAPATAASLYGRAGEAEVLAVLADGSRNPESLRAALASALTDPGGPGEPVTGLSVAVGAERGDAENTAVAVARPDLVQLSIAFGTLAITVALLVIGGLLALSVRERAREFALLRAVGATPWQVRGMLLRETLAAGVPAAILGGLGSLGLAALMHHAMVERGVLPEGFALVLGPLPVLAGIAVALLAALLTGLPASLRLSRIRPVQALGEAAVESAALPRWRTVTGCAFLVLGMSALGVSAASTGPTATASIGGLVVALIAATAFLGPQVARFGSRVLGGAARLVAPVTGGLAQQASAAAALRAGSIMTPVALAVAFCGTQLFALSTVADATAAQAAAGTTADQVVVSAGPGLPRGVAERVRRLPGVTAVTPVKRTTVVMAVREMGEQTLRSLPAQGVGADAEATMDPKALSGRLGDLRGDTVALSRDVAGGFEVGSAVPLHLGDGTLVRPRLVAVYERGLGFGDVLLPRDLVTAHASASLDDHLLVRGDADLSAATAPYTGVRALDAAAFGTELSRDLRIQGFVNLVVVGAIAGFVIIGLVTTLALATAARRREFALLRLVGTTRRQLLRMLRLEAAIVLGTGITVGTLIAAVTLTAFAAAVTGLPLPVVSPTGAALLLLAVAGAGTASVMLPARLILRRRTSPKIP